MSIRSIETRYAGCRFRSRLEARWAVFLDAARINWEYEPQGVIVSLARRGQRKKQEMAWLPDFYLPETDQVVEVKGQLDETETARLLFLASEVSLCGPGRDVVVLGRIPRPGSGLWPLQLHNHDGLWALPWDLMTGCPLQQHRPRIDLSGRDPLTIMDWLLDGMLCGTEPAWATGALTRARSARFEHGERG